MYESNVGRAGTVIPHVSEGVGVVVAEDDGRVHIVNCLRGEGVAFYADVRSGGGEDD